MCRCSCKIKEFIVKRTTNDDNEGVWIAPRVSWDCQQPISITYEWSIVKGNKNVEIVGPKNESSVNIRVKNKDDFSVKCKITVKYLCGNEVKTTSCEKTKEFGCLIATAAYGSPYAPQVEFLRHVRDHELRKKIWGRKLVDNFEQYYYKFSPKVSRMMKKNHALKLVIRWTIVAPYVYALYITTKSIRAITKVKEI